MIQNGEANSALTSLSPSLSDEEVKANLALVQIRLGLGEEDTRAVNTNLVTQPSRRWLQFAGNNPSNTKQ